MATYAAYRHVELDKVGCGKRSIMKPPGGDCHDIFGADFHGTPSHHRVLKPPGGGTSGLFSSPANEVDKARANNSSSEISTAPNSLSSFNCIEVKTNGVNGKAGNVSFAHLLETSKTNDDSSISDSVSTHPSPSLSAEITSLSVQEEKNRRVPQRNCVTGEGCQTTDHYVIRVHRQRDGNPVTGEGYDAAETHPAAPQRARIPPGGYSSGLW